MKIIIACSKYTEYVVNIWNTACSFGGCNILVHLYAFEKHVIALEYAQRNLAGMVRQTVASAYRGKKTD